MVRQSGEKGGDRHLLAIASATRSSRWWAFSSIRLCCAPQLSGKPSFVDYLQQCREEDLAAFDHQLYRFEALAEAIGADRTTAINPIFQIMLVYQARWTSTISSPAASWWRRPRLCCRLRPDISVR